MTSDRWVRVAAAPFQHALRSAIRQLRYAPVYAATMIATLAIGVAAASAIFSVVRGVLLRPLPYADPGSIVSVQEHQPAQRRDQTTVASANLSRIAGAQSLTALAAFSYSEYVVSDERDAVRVLGARVDGELFNVLGVRPALGRGVRREESGDNPARVAVISDALWRRRFAADPRAVGRSVVIDGAPYIIIGVMSPRFEFPRNSAMARDVDVWVPRRPAAPMMLRRGMRDLTVIARLRPGATLEAAQRELATISDQLRLENASINDGWALRVVGLRDVMVGGVRAALLMLSVCVAVLLLITTVNAAAAALARVVIRRQSLGVRLALGATPSAVAGLLVAESCLLAILALIVALPASAVLRRVLIDAAPVAIPRQNGIAVDSWTVLFAAAVAILTALLSAAGPAAWVRRFDVTTFLSDATRTSAGSRGRSRALALFVVTQLALGTVLLSTTARLYSNFALRNHVDPGFVADHVTTATLALGGMRYQDPRARAVLTARLLEVVRPIPGVEHAAMTSLLPMSGGLMTSTFTAPGFVSDSSHSAALRAVSDDFFAALRIPIRRGRPLAQRDAEGALPVVVINEALERDVFGGRDALGQSIVVSPPGSDAPRAFQIVGIAGNATEKELLGPPTPVVYFSDRQASFPHSVLVVRSRTEFPAAAVRAVLRELDPTLALDDVGGLSEKVRASYALQFFLLMILGVFASAGILLIGVGVYGSVSFTVAAELKAIGVRMALGASPASILALVIERTGRHAATGCMIGLVTAIAVPMFLRVDTVLGTSPGWVAIGLGGVGVLALALVATVVPAWRASALDPISILRE